MDELSNLKRIFILMLSSLFIRIQQGIRDLEIYNVYYLHIFIVKWNTGCVKRTNLYSKFAWIDRNFASGAGKLNRTGTTKLLKTEKIHVRPLKVISSFVLFGLINVKLL